MLRRISNLGSLLWIALVALAISTTCFAVVLTRLSVLPIGGIVTLSVTGFAALGAVIGIIVCTVGNEPSFFTKHDVAVWTNGISSITQDLMEAAFDNYLDKVTVQRPDISRDSLLQMYSKMMVVWFEDKVGAIGVGYSLQDKAGLQNGYVIHLHWTGSVSSSALFHEIHHMVDDIVLHKPVDYTHADKEWWKVIGE